MTSCTIPDLPELHPTLAHRFSPVRFREDAVVERAHVETMLEAARRAPSAGNSQPWRFVVGVRGDDVHERIVRHLARSSGAWAPAASAIVVNLAVVGIEVALIASVMLSGDGSPTLARDTMFAVVMIVLNFLTGLSLLLGALRFGEQNYNLAGARSFLSVLLPLAVPAMLAAAWDLRPP